LTPDDLRKATSRAKEVLQVRLAQCGAAVLDDDGLPPEGSDGLLAVA
jgi:hypothetical protein